MIRSLFLIAGLLFTAQGVMAQSCCDVKASSSASGPSPTVKFASLASDSDFRMSHQEPKESQEMSATGTMVTFTTPDGKTAFAYEIKPEKETKNVLLVFHEWWGLNDNIKAEAAALAKAVGNVRVLALDLYDGKVTGKREEAGQLMQASKPERSVAIIQGALNYVGKDANILTVGWCFGGGWSLQAGLTAGPQASASVIYYGMPESDGEKLKSLNAKVLGIFAKKDGWINEKVVSEFEAAMKKAGKSAVIHWYDADHAFANPSNPKYDKEKTMDAMAKTVAFLKENLK